VVEEQVQLVGNATLRLQSLELTQTTEQRPPGAVVDVDAVGRPDPLEEPLSEQPPAAVRDEAQRFGTAFHSVMEQIDLMRQQVELDDPLLLQAARSQSVLHRIGELCSLINGTLGCPVLGEVRDSLLTGRSVLRELPICTPLSRKAQERL